MVRTDLLIEYFNKQKEILNLLEESNNIISELFNDQKEDTQLGWYLRACIWKTGIWDSGIDACYRNWCSELLSEQ